MTPDDLAALHAAAFDHPRSWQADEFRSLLAQPHTRLYHRPGCFALTRTLADESELLTLATAPPHRRRGLARGLLAQWLEETQGTRAFLEVAADNSAARALYGGLGFAQVGLRRGYYTRDRAPAIDAIVMARDLTRG